MDLFPSANLESSAVVSLSFPRKRQNEKKKKKKDNFIGSWWWRAKGNVLGPLHGKDKWRLCHIYMHLSLSGIISDLSLPLTFAFLPTMAMLFPRIGMLPRWHRKIASDIPWLIAEELSNHKGMLVLLCQHLHISPRKGSWSCAFPLDPSLQPVGSGAMTS